MNFSKKKPPLIAKKLLRILSSYERKFSLVGDVEEEFNEFAKKNGILYAKLWYWRQVFVSVPLFFKSYYFWSFIMFNNYLKIALRNIKKHKIYSFINITGLATGLACSILIFLWVSNELSYDRFHTNFNEIYRADLYGGVFGDGYDGSQYPLGPESKKIIPEIKNYVRFWEFKRSVFKYGNNAFYESKGVYSDPSVFDLFSFSLISGNPETALADKNSIVINEAIAEKYFRDEEPVGKTLEIDSKLYTVTGVLKTFPANSHIKFDFIIPFAVVEAEYANVWFNRTFCTYFQLNKNTGKAEVTEKINSIFKEHSLRSYERGIRFRLEPLSKIHLFTQSRRGWTDIADAKYVYVFSAVAVFILLIACINFMNLSTARSSIRAKEVGLRKTVGANRKQLIRQFFSESFLLTVLSSVIALILVTAALPFFNTQFEKQLSVDFFDYKIFLGILGVIIVTGLASGSYPALYLSSFRPAGILKNRSKSGAGSSRFRKILVVTQFFLSIVLLIGTAVIYKQMDYIRKKDLGFNMGNTIILPNSEKIGKQYSVIKNALLQDPDVAEVTAQNYSFSKIQFWSNNLEWEGMTKNSERDMIWTSVDFGYFEMFGISMLDGRAFSGNKVSDKKSAFIVNEAAVKQMELESPVGKRFVFKAFGKNDIRNGTIIGVIKDIHLKSLYEKIQPHLFLVMNDFSWWTSTGKIIIKFRETDSSIGENNMAAVIGRIKQIWEKFEPSVPFEYQFLEEAYDNFYGKEKRTGMVINFFTFLAVLISCLGLFGLASFMVELRIKEIGIRKVLGASSAGLVYIISKEFFILVAAANIFAWPAGFYIMNLWLGEFAYRVDIGFLPLLLSGFAAVVIALATVSFQAFKAAGSNPSNCLRHE